VLGRDEVTSEGTGATVFEELNLDVPTTNGAEVPDLDGVVDHTFRMKPIYNGLHFG